MHRAVNISYYPHTNPGGNRCVYLSYNFYKL